MGDVLFSARQGSLAICLPVGYNADVIHIVLNEEQQI